MSVIIIQLNQTHTAMRSLLFMLTLSVALFSCDKESSPCDDTQTLETRIQGAWELTDIFNPWTQTSQAPTPAQRQTLTFGDSLTIIGADTTTVSAYQITDDQLISNGASGTVSIDCNILVIDNTPVDGPRNTYSRVLEE